MMDSSGASAFWRFETVARPDDPRWLDAQRYDHVLVRAETLGEAIRTAERELGRTPAGASDTVGNETPSERSGFGDAKLYVARQVSADDVSFEASGPPTVLDTSPSRA